ncbi:ABC-2 transporter permease [Acetobacterium sp.]|uniref:ABC-2 transporter permease n=1 Tax=Acetobacterium sp. TaxID=1872094 RepID=UPI0027161D0B|nr:ABC-2 transporter permease [Acetobacterium sp.]MDO9492125.1 ABC-2 transporter permease [Acetobacterium sp.]
MKGLILKDLLNLKSTFKMLGLMIFLFAVIYIPQGNGFIFGMIILMVSMMVVTTISYDDLAKWDAYALTMPVTRKEIVLSKYLVMALLNTLGAVLALIVGIIGSMIMGQSFSTEVLAIIGVLYLIAFSYGSMMVPLIYRFGTEKARLMLILSALIPTGLILLVTQMQIPLPEAANPLIYFFLLLGFTVIMVFVSFFISLRIYSNKEF